MRQTGGNALALVELPKALSATQLSGQAPLPATLPLTVDVQRVFLDRCRHLEPGGADAAAGRGRRRLDPVRNRPRSRGPARCRT